VELRRALLRRKHAPEEIETVLARLRARGLLNDGAYAERFARSRLQNGGLGSRRVDQALRARGVSREAAREGLASALQQIDEGLQLERVARAYWRSHGRDEASVRLRKLTGFLLRRGFPPALVHAHLRALWPELRAALADVDAQAEAHEMMENHED
jgi:regulatory protein